MEGEDLVIVDSNQHSPRPSSQVKFHREPKMFVLSQVEYHNAMLIEKEKTYFVLVKSQESSFPSSTIDFNKFEYPKENLFSFNQDD